jgi:hypothetical protein
VSVSAIETLRQFTPSALHNVILFRPKVKRHAIVTMLLCLPLAACNVPLFSYPLFWDYSKTRPADSDLFGSYRVLKLRLPSELSAQVTEREPRITLNADHTAVLANVPEFDGFGEKLECRWSGSATWELNDKINIGWGWSVAFKNFHPSSKVTTTQDCNKSDFIWGILILSRHPPYRLYGIVGDPDSDTGIEYEKLR